MIKKQRHEKLDGRKVGNKIAMKVSYLTSKERYQFINSQLKLMFCFFNQIILGKHIRFKDHRFYKANIILKL